MNKKGQAAMEFLMTYGWAILVVIAAIAALAYFGVLDPARLLPERCQSSAGMDCIDKAVVTQTGVTIALRNNIGQVAEIQDVSGTQCDGDSGGIAGTSGDPVTAGTFAAFNVSNNQVFRVRIDCGLTSGSRYDDTVIISYRNTDTGLEHNVPVDIRGRVA